MDLVTLTLLILGLTAISVFGRGAFVLFFPRIGLPPALQRALRFVPPATFAALVAPELLMAAGRLSIGLDNPRLVAGAIAALIAWRTRSTLVTVLIGMIMLHLLKHWPLT